MDSWATGAERDPNKHINKMLNIIIIIKNI